MTKTTKRWLIIATFLLLTGCVIFGGVMTVYKWDFSKLSTNKYETNKYDINDNFKNISVNVKTADIVFVASEKAKAEVVCYEQDNANHEVSVDNDTLTIKLVDERKWYEYIGINFRTPKITVYLPQGEYGNLTVSSTTGDTKIPSNHTYNSIDISASTGDVECRASALESIKIKLNTGDIDIENITAENVDLTVTTGEIEAKSITCNSDFKTKVSTGEVELKDVSCKNLSSNGNTGDITLKDVIAEEKFAIERSTGDVKFEHCDANEIFVKTDTGDVKGSLLSDKVFITQTDTGNIDVPKTITGGRCEITTDTGDIKITVDF